MSGRLKVFQKPVVESGDGVLNTPFRTVNEFKGVKVWLYKGKQVLQHDLLQAFHGQRCESNGSVVVQFGGFGFLGDWDNERGFTEGGDSPGVNRLLENRLESRRQ